MEMKSGSGSELIFELRTSKYEIRMLSIIPPSNWYYGNSYTRLQNVRCIYVHIKNYKHDSDVS
jgi:hypothetical protein